MEMEQAAKHLTKSGETTAARPSEEQLIAIDKWVRMLMELNHKEISQLGMSAYIEGLKDLSVAEIERGCQRAIKEVPYMPTVAHIRQRVNVYEEGLSGAGERGCELCRYTGWRLVPRTDGPGDVARKCECSA